MRTAIVFVHGMFMTGSCWEPMAAHFTSRGYRCLTPSWPCRAGEPEALRGAPDPGLRELTPWTYIGAASELVDFIDSGTGQ